VSQNAGHSKAVALSAPCIQSLSPALSGGGRETIPIADLRSWAVGCGDWSVLLEG
jgi:hypothetical protein